jgi:hypothetical protein
MRVGRGTGLGCGGLLLVLVLSYFLGADPRMLLEMLGGAGGGPPIESGSTQVAPAGPPSDELGEFASVVLADLEDTWDALFAAQGVRYAPPTLVLFSDAVRSGCGFASAAVGPFYCPLDRQVYLDLAFFGALDRRFGAPGDFAQAYVIAHEVGHHVQNELGISDRVRRAQQSARSQEEANAYSVRLELQADCLAGVWASHAHRERQLLEPGDVEEGLAAASAIGDDNLQRQAQGYVVPESFTHGSAAQRVEWLRRGLETGDPDACETL